MAFETYLQQDKGRPSRARRITYLVSAIAHALAVLAAVAYSFWHVEELTPPTVMVTFISAAAAPPPPPPPPPLGGGASAPAPKPHKAVVRPKVEVPKPTEIVQPKQPDKEVPQEAPKEEPKTEPKTETKPANAEGQGAGAANGVKGGVAGGVKGGTVGGTVGGTASAPVAVASKFLPPQMGAQQKISGADPDFPAHLRKSGANFLVMAKICVAAAGAVESVTLLKRAEPTLDNNVVTRVKTWRFRPLMANGTPAPFCYFGRFEFKSD
ncbi:MAG: energy transducer TonB [Bacteroidota bacterium]